MLTLDKQIIQSVYKYEEISFTMIILNIILLAKCWTF